MTSHDGGGSVKRALGVPAYLVCWCLALAGGLLGFTLAPAQSLAKECGNGTACACGDTVQGVAVLDADIGPCEHLGLGVTTGSVLDCSGHTITGSDQNGWYGIELDTVSGAQVRNCRVTSFRRGLRVFAGGGHWLVGNQIFETRNYGIELAAGTVGNRVEGNVVQDSGDEGIHIGNGAIDNAVVGNQVTGSKLENVYLLEATGTRVVGNVMADARNAAIFIKHSHGSYVADNVVWDNPIHLRGDSSGNVLEDNALRGDGYVLEAFLENDTVTYPHQNEVMGGNVFNAGTCVQLLGARDNRIEAVTIDDDCVAVAEAPEAGVEPSGNVVDFAITEPGRVGARAAAQVSVNARQLHAGDPLTVGIAVHNGPFNDPLDLYVGVFLPDGQIVFFIAGPGGLTVSPTPMQSVAKGESVTLPRFLDVALPSGLPSGTYQFFAALVTPGALADGVVTALELAAFDAEAFTIVP